MYGILSVIFTTILTITHYLLSTNSSSPFITKDVTLNKQLVTNGYQIFATCVDKQLLSPNPFIDLQIMSLQQQSFIVIFDSNPLLQCQQIIYALDFSQLDKKTQQIQLDKKTQQIQLDKKTQQIQFDKKTQQIQFDKINMLKALIGETQIIHLQKGKYQEIKNQKQFLLMLTAKSIKEPIKDGETKVTLQLQNQTYLQELLQCVFWFSMFNLIAISLISYYRKNVFNQKIHILTSVAILLYLIWVSLRANPSYQQLQDQLKIAMLAFILLICIKLRLTLPQTLLIVFLSVANQVTLDMEINAQVKWLVFAANLFNLSTIYLGQNHETVHFSILSFLIQYGLVNPFIQIVHPLVLSLIFVNLLFGPTIYELLQLRQDVTIQVKKTQQRLQSYEVSEHDHLFIN